MNSYQKRLFHLAILCFLSPFLFAQGKPTIRKGRQGLPKYWLKRKDLNASLPRGMKVYEANYLNRLSETQEPKKIKAFAILLDPKLVDFKPTYSSKRKSPKEFIADEPGSVWACVNAGFFGTVPYSLLRYHGTTYADNAKAVTRHGEQGQVHTYYPTRAAFGLSSAGQPEVAWVYAFADSLYAYDRPYPNEVHRAPLPQPQKKDGRSWDSYSAVGGAPMLIKDGKIELTSAEELADLDNTIPRARTAIGYNAKGKIILLTIEGEHKGVSEGLNLAELAQLMKAMGCIGAINLDGGGSTVLYIKGELMIRPSSSDKEREMPGVILIKSKK